MKFGLGKRNDKVRRLRRHTVILDDRLWIESSDGIQLAKVARTESDQNESNALTEDLG